jgi:hypothetical protein
MPVRDLLSAASGIGEADDPNFNYVSLLLNGDGTNGAQNNTFLDSSTNNFTITRNGNTTQGSFSPYGTLWSNFFNGSNSYLTVADNAALQFGTGAFTIEAWVNLSRVSGYQVVLSKYTSSTNGYEIGINAGVVSANFSGDGADITGTTTLSVGVWYHIAVSGTPGATGIKLFVNGVQEGSTYTGSTSLSPTATLNIGRFGGNSDYLQGYISNLRLVKGTAVYTSNFTPSATPLTVITNTSLLTCADNRFVDDSANNFTISVFNNASVQRFSPFNPTAPYSTSVIGGSGYFDGSGDHLTLAANSNWQFTGNFTIECWVYPTGFGSDRRVLHQGDTGTQNIIFYITSAGGFQFFYDGGSNFITSSINLRLNTWQHIAGVRSGSTITLYINGVSAGTATSSATCGNGAQGFAIGSNGGGTDPYLGYVSDVRLNGTALYTAAFTPPTAPLTAVTSTRLLTNMTNAGIPDLAMQNNLQTVGNAQVSTSVKKYGTGSLAFDGTGDWLSAPANALFRFGSANFTIEMWVYLPAGSQKIAWHNNGPVTGNQNVVGVGTITANTWTHVAVTKQGTTIRLFLNGTLDNSGTVAATLQNNADPLFVGRGADHTGSGASGRDMVHCGETGGNEPKWFFYLTGNGTGDFNGYMDDLRITTGLARYTASFTPPASNLPTY